MQNMSYARSVFTVESDMLPFWAVQRGRNAWLLEMVLRCNRTIILASAVPEITSANGCTADSVLFEPCQSFLLHKSSKYVFNHILLPLLKNPETSHYCTSLEVSEDKVLFKLQTMSSKNRRRSWTLVKCLSFKELCICVVTQLLTRILLGREGGGWFLGGKTFPSLIK